MKTFKRLLFVVVLGILFSSSSSAQCQCNLTVVNNSVGSYNVGPNYVLCINAGLTYTGTINLNGGTLCNNGTVSKINFNSGTFENYGQYVKTGNLSIQNSGNITINSHSGSVFRVTGNLDIQSGNINIVTTVNLLEGKSSFEIQGSFNTSKGILAMNPKTKEKLFTEGVFINIGKDFYVGGNAGLVMNIGQGTYFNVNKSASFDGKYNKTINNYGGVININSDFNIAGNGQNIGVFNLMNTGKGSLVIKKSFNAAYNNGTVNITNYASMEVGKTWTQSKDVTNVLNYGKLSITQDLNIERGSFTNNYMLTARDGDVKFGTLTNNYYTNFTRDLITSNSSAIINNNSYLLVNREFNNIATVNLAEKSTIETTRYYNLNNGIINGSPSLPDTLSFARVYISGYSENKGYLNNRIIIYDRTLQYTTNNAGFGFDVIGNANRIASSVIFASRLPITIGPPIFNCLLTNFIYNISAFATPSQVCAGIGTVQLNSQLNSISFIGGSISYQPVLSTPVNSYTWSPAANFSNPVGQVQTISSPNVTTTYIVKVKIGNCTIQKNVVVSVVPPLSVVINANQTLPCLNPALILSTPAVSGAASYQWYEGLTPVSGATGLSINPINIGSYYVKVLNSIGCASLSNTITVLESPVVNVTTSANNICAGSSAVLTANVTSGIISTYQWQKDNVNTGTNLSTLNANSSGAYNVIVTANNGCSSSSNVVSINVSNGLVANAGNSQVLVAPGSVSLNGSASGGVAPYSYNWTPNTYFIPVSNATLPNPVVNLTSTTTFALNVTDAAGCQASDYVNILLLNGVVSYGHLKKNIDGGYYQASNNKVYFKFDEEYKGVPLQYNIYNYNINAGTSGAPVQIINSCSGLNITTVMGDNRYYIDLVGCGYTFVANNYYLLEVVNSKKEKFYLKFKA